MIDEMGARMTADKDDLDAFFEELTIHESDSFMKTDNSYEQMTLSDLISD